MNFFMAFWRSITSFTVAVVAAVVTVVVVVVVVAKAALHPYRSRHCQGLICALV